MNEQKNRKYTLNIIPDKEGEEFTHSSCDCKDCMLMHMAQIEWDTFKPETNLQKRMKKVVSKLEKDIENRKKNIK